MSPGPSPRVTRLEPLDRRALRVRVHLDDGGALELALAVVEREALGVGDPVDPALRARLQDADLRGRVRETALGLLARRPRSRAEVRRRLRRKDVPAPVAEACVEQLAAEGLLDDAAFAEAWVRDRLRLKPRGRRRLMAELTRKGVDPATAEAAVERELGDADGGEAGLAVEVALKWLRTRSDAVASGLAGAPFTPERERALRRLHGYLARRGFGGEDLRRAVDAAVETAGGG